jgi:hypothetical protein
MASWVRQKEAAARWFVFNHFLGSFGNTRFRGPPFFPSGAVNGKSSWDDFSAGAAGLREVAGASD